MGASSGIRLLILFGLPRSRLRCGKLQPVLLKIVSGAIQAAAPQGSFVKAKGRPGSSRHEYLSCAVGALGQCARPIPQCRAAATEDFFPSLMNSFDVRLAMVPGLSSTEMDMLPPRGCS